MGGTPEILKQIAQIIIGTYGIFVAQFVNIGLLYRVKNKDKSLNKNYGKIGDDSERNKKSND